MANLNTLLPHSILLTATTLLIALLNLSNSAFAGLATPLLEQPPLLEDIGSKKQSGLDLEKAKLATVIVFLSARCPCSASHEPTLTSLYKDFSNNGFNFIAIHSNGDESPTLTEQHFKTSQLPFKILQDSKQHVADTLGALKTPHVFVVDPKGGILYQGGVDESRVQAQAKNHYLRDALQAILEKKEIQNKSTRTLGCIISRNNQ